MKSHQIVLIVLSVFVIMFFGYQIGAQTDETTADTPSRGAIPKLQSLPVGTVLYSVLEEKLFNKLYEGTWVIMKGQNIINANSDIDAKKYNDSKLYKELKIYFENLYSKTKLHLRDLNRFPEVNKDEIEIVKKLLDNYTSELRRIKTLPDLRGRFIRCRNYDQDGKKLGNPDGDKPVGTYQQDEFKSHSHGFGCALGDRINGWGDRRPYVANRSTGAAGGAETRPRNVTLNVYIKIN